MTAEDFSQAIITLLGKFHFYGIHTFITTGGWWGLQTLCSVSLIQFTCRS